MERKKLAPKSDLTRERERERGESEALQDYYYAKYLRVLLRTNTLNFVAPNLGTLMSRTFALTLTHIKKEEISLLILDDARHATTRRETTRVVRRIKSEIDARILPRNTRSFHFFAVKVGLCEREPVRVTTLTRRPRKTRVKSRANFANFRLGLNREKRTFIKRSSKNFREKKTKKNRNK